MATNLQVTANTSQAVGAFNQLATAIAGARGQFQNLNTVLANGATAARTYGNAVTTNITGAFSRLASVAEGLFTVLKFVGAGIELVFSSLLRELDKLQGFNAIMSVTTKSSETAAQSYDFLRKTADRLGVQFDALSGNYAKLVAAIPEGTNQLNIANRAFLGVAMAARTLHASNQDTQLMFYAVTQIASKGIVSMEELRRQLGEKLPGVIQIAAKALNTVPEELEKAIRKGIVISEKFLPIFGDALIRTFSDSSELAAKSVSASINRLTNVWVDFVKEVLDSGAGQAIVGVFDALREKLSDPYLIQRFADFIKYLADKFAEFVKGLTADDIRNGFDTATHAIEAMISVMEKLVGIFTWIINNGAKAGAIIGGLAGAAGGMVLGPWGALAGGVVGAAGGAYVGSQVSPTDSDFSRRSQEDARANQALEEARLERIKVETQMLLPILQQFKGLNSLKDVQGLFKPERMNQDTVKQLVDILADPKYKTDKDRAGAAIDFSKYGVALSPAGSNLSDVLGGKGKPDKAALAAAKSMDATYMRAQGLNPDFYKELNNLTTLWQKGKLSIDEYRNAAEDLYNKQPIMIEATKNEKKELVSYNKEMEAWIDLAVRQVTAKEDLRQSLEDDMRLAGMRGEALSLELSVTQALNRLREVGIQMSSSEITALREKFRLIEQTKAITQAQDQILGATVDKYKSQVIAMQAMVGLLADPSSGFTKTDASSYLSQQDPKMENTPDWQEVQKASLMDYYAFVEGLRQKDLVSEQTAQMMKAKAQVDYDTQRLQQTGEFFGNLSSLSKSGNSEIAAIGRAAAIAQATMDGVLAVQKALASAPPPWNYAMAAAVGVAAAANVAQIAGIGFYNGGYTGNGAQGRVAGVVHGQEFVMNASATARNRATLEAMNRGQAVQQSPTSSGTVQVIVNNNADGTKATTQERDTPTGKQIEVTIERVFIQGIRKGNGIASALEGQYGLNRAVGTAR